MRVTRVITKQGHPVPSSAHSPKGPFPPELFAAPEIITEYTSFDDDNPIGATAQNNFKSPKMFRCNECSMVIFEHEMPDHVCERTEDVDGSYA